MMANHKNAEVERNLLKHFKLVWIWKLSSWLVYYFFYLSLAPGRVRKIRLLFSVSMYKQKKTMFFSLFHIEQQRVVCKQLYFTLQSTL